MTDHISFQDAPLPVPGPNKVERGPISVKGTNDLEDLDPTVAERLANAIRGWPGAAIMQLDTRDEDGLVQVIVFAREEVALDEIVKELNE